MTLRIILIAGMLALLGACSISPQEQKDQAFARYSHICVSYGFALNTSGHTDCVMQRYEQQQNAQEQAEHRIIKRAEEKEQQAAAVKAAAAEKAVAATKAAEATPSTTNTNSNTEKSE